MTKNFKSYILHNFLSLLLLAGKQILLRNLFIQKNELILCHMLYNCVISQ